MKVQKIPAVHMSQDLLHHRSESLHFLRIYDQKLPGPSASEGCRTPDQGKKRFERFEGKREKKQKKQHANDLVWYF